MYADDLLLVAASIRKLQLMVDICCSEAIKLGMKLVAFSTVEALLCYNVIMKNAYVPIPRRLSLLGSSRKVATAMKERRQQGMMRFTT